MVIFAVEIKGVFLSVVGVLQRERTIETCEGGVEKKWTKNRQF